MQKSRMSCKLKKKLIACGKVQCKRRLDSVAASPREYLVRRPAKNVISPPPEPPQTPPPKKKQPPKKQQCKIVQRARAPRAAHTKKLHPNTVLYKPWSNYIDMMYIQKVSMMCWPVYIYIYVYIICTT